MFTVFAFETVTGRVIGTIPCNIKSWARVLDGTDTASVVMLPGTLTVKSRDYYRLITTPMRSSLVIDWDGVPITAGPILTREWTGTDLTLNITDARSIFSRRKAHTWATPYASQVITYSGISLGTIAVNLVKLGISNLKLGASLPIVFPPDEADTDPTHVRTYNGYELIDIATELANLTNDLNGPDIDFLPQWTDSSRTYLQYQMRVGTLEQPALYSPQTVVFDGSQPRSSVENIDTIDDASLLGTTDWATGAGDTASMLMSMTQSTDLVSKGWPLLEQETDYKTVSDQAVLDSKTLADLAAHALPTEQWTMNVDATLAPVLGSYLLGDRARVRVKNDVWTPDDDYQMRIIGMSGDSSTKIKLDVQNA